MRLFDSRLLSRDEYQMAVIILETGALGKYDNVLFRPFKTKSPEGHISHVLYLPGSLKFMIMTGRGTFPTAFQPFLVAEPDYFWLTPCPKELMHEVKYIPAMLRKMRRAEARKI